MNNNGNLVNMDSLGILTKFVADNGHCEVTMAALADIKTKLVELESQKSLVKRVISFIHKNNIINPLVANWVGDVKAVEQFSIESAKKAAIEQHTMANISYTNNVVSFVSKLTGHENPVYDRRSSQRQSSKVVSSAEKSPIHIFKH